MEITANALQPIEPNMNIMFDSTIVPGKCSIMHNDGSGLVTLRSMSCGQCRSRFRVVFTGNLKADIASPVSGTTLLSLAATTNGEIIMPSVMIISVADTVSTYNVSTEFYIDVPKGCCTTIAIKNISDITVDTVNANLIVERIA